MSEPPAHPRPQLTRPGWTDLCGRWEFAYDDGDVGLDQAWWQRAEPYPNTVTVPFPPESAASSIGDAGDHPVLWYRRAFPLTPPAAGDRVLLHFGAVDYHTRVWVNGQLVATHDGGHTPFEADITAILRAGGEQVVVVRAEDRATELCQPRGKQYSDRVPTDIWYHRTSGIWQPVWLETAPATRVRTLRWTPDVARGTIAVHAEIAGRLDQRLSLRVSLRLDGDVLVEDTYSLPTGVPRADREIALGAARNGQQPRRLLWSPEHPTLLDAEVSVLAGEQILDRVYSYVGFRDVGVDRDRFLLNGQPYFLRMVLEQGYWPSSHLAAPDEAALRREVEWIKRLGFNGVRVHQKLEDPRFLYWCDRLGVLVWAEMPSCFEFSTRAAERLISEWTEAVARDASHPCVVAWVPLNESWGVPNLAGDPAQRHYAAALCHLTHALDPTRPVISNDGWEHLESDIWTVHDYAPTGQTLRDRYGDAGALDHTLRDGRPGGHPIRLHDTGGQRRPVMVTEYGGLSHAPRPDQAWFGYATVTTDGELTQRYRELTSALLDSDAIAGFCYTQLTDTQQETNGLLTAERAPKLDPDVIRAANTQPARTIPAEHIAAHREPARDTPGDA